MLKMEDIVVDIGACIGIFSIDILRKNIKYCYSIEPIESNFNDLKENLNDNKDKFKFIKGAIHNEDRDVKFNFSDGVAELSKHNNNILVNGIKFSTFLKEK